MFPMNMYIFEVPLAIAGMLVFKTAINDDPIFRQPIFGP